MSGGLVTGLGGPDLVDGVEGILGPDHETAKVGTRGELEEVEGLNRGNLDTGDVAESLDDALVLLVDDKGAEALGGAAATVLTLTSTEVLAVDDTSNVLLGTDRLEELKGLLGLGEGLDVGANDERDLGDLLDLVATGENKGSDTGGSNGSGSSVALLVLVHLDVPLAPGLGGGEHTTGTAHVTEGTLARGVGTRATDTGDTGDGTTGTPGLSRGLLTSVSSDGVSLTLVLVHGDENRVNKVNTEGSAEDLGEGHVGTSALDSNLRSRHFSVDGYKEERKRTLVMIVPLFFSGYPCPCGYYPYRVVKVSLLYSSSIAWNSP